MGAIRTVDEGFVMDKKIAADQQAVKDMGFIPACKKFFGFKSNQDLGQFRDECNTLTAQDRVDMVPGLESELGVKIRA